MVVSKNVPCEMKLSHYLRYYERRHGIRLLPEAADKEAAKEGFVLDHSGGIRDSGRQPDREQGKNAMTPRASVFKKSENTRM